MFEQSLQLHYNNYNQVGFSIIPYINRAINISNNHPIIILAINEINGLNINPQNFNRVNLLEIWNNNEVSFSSKILTTFWWGGLSHAYSAPMLYNNENLDNFHQISDELNILFNNMIQLSNTNDINNTFRNIYDNLQNGVLHINGINTSFFTKIFQFYFESNPINIENFSQPIIADQWSKKAVFAEMITQNYNWENIFTAPNCAGNTKFDVKFTWGNEFDKYMIFNNFFNNRVNQLINNYNELTPFRLEEIVFGWSRDINNPNNPRYISENIIRNYFNN